MFTLAEEFLRAIRYEHWLRYHFFDFDAENAGAEAKVENRHQVATMRVPEEWVRASAMGEPDLFPLLEQLQNKRITLEDSRAALFEHVAAAQGRSMEEDNFGQMLFNLIADPDFRRKLDAFHAWVQEVAEAEDLAEIAAEQNAQSPNFTPVSFAQWEANHAQWVAEKAVMKVTQIPQYKDTYTG